MRDPRIVQEPSAPVFRIIWRSPWNQQSCWRHKQPGTPQDHNLAKQSQGIEHREGWGTRRFRRRDSRNNGAAFRFRLTAILAPWEKEGEMPREEVDG